MCMVAIPRCTVAVVVVGFQVVHRPRGLLLGGPLGRCCWSSAHKLGIKTKTQGTNAAAAVHGEASRSGSELLCL